MMTLKEYLEAHGRKYPEPDGEDGSISMAAFDAEHLPMVVACTNCSMTMACRSDLPVDDNGHIYCYECADAILDAQDEASRKAEEGRAGDAILVYIVTHWPVHNAPEVLASKLTGVFSTLDRAKEEAERGRNLELNPGPIEWREFTTDMKNVVVWETTYITAYPEGGRASITITQYPFDQFSLDLAGIPLVEEV
jgi:hypothetical protein